MQRLWALLVSAPLFAAGIIPNRYIVELSTESVAQHVTRTAAARSRSLLRSDAAREHRALVRAEQRAASREIRGINGNVLGSLENVVNALIVTIPDAQAGRLATIPGVRKVYPVREFHLLLDHALQIHRLPQAWSQSGYDQAGRGIKIALIDTGIDNTHPGFQDPSLTIPDGFPITNADSDRKFTNNKVIVARSYSDLFDTPDPDPSARDRVGHGTATAMAAAGVLVSAPLANISGVAPKAYLGSYKVFGTPGVNDGASEDAILKAIDDAVADGMDVLSLSLGSDVAVRFADDPEIEALDNAAAAGLVVVASAGNNGPDPATVGSPAVAPSVIAVGASSNDRMFSASVLVDGRAPILAIPGSGPKPSASVSAPVKDVSTLDGDGQACSALPEGSLQGSIAFILRGVCFFEVKLSNAAAAGAVGAIVYTDADRPTPIVMAVGAATLPAEMISFQDGQTLKSALSSGITATLQFTLGPAYVDPARLADFSAKGPNIDFSIKPDLVAVGTNLYTAAEMSDSAATIHSPDGYAVEQGTSFSAPLVAGGAALLKSARPGLTADQYRSLLINSAAQAWLVPGTPARTQQAGAGLLDMVAALNATAAAAPVSLGFGAGPPDVRASRNLTISNVGTNSDLFRITAVPLGAGPVPQLSSASLQLDGGASQSITVSFSGTALKAGEYEGYIAIQGSASGFVTRVPYWYGVASGQPRYLTILFTSDGGRAGARISDAALFRVSDQSGLPVTDAQPTVTVVSGGGQIISVRSRDAAVPNTFGFNVRLGPRPGPNVFQIQVGDLTKTVTITGQ